MKMTYDDFEPPEAPCSECERLKAQFEKLERKLKDKENALARMQSQRDHMSQKLAELTGYTPKEVRDGVKLLALGIKDKLAVKQDPDLVTFDGIPGKWFPHVPGDASPVDDDLTIDLILHYPANKKIYKGYTAGIQNWTDLHTPCIIAYRPADREDMR